MCSQLTQVFLRFGCLCRSSDFFPHGEAKVSRQTGRHTWREFAVCSGLASIDFEVDFGFST